jgi:hypothetical protein
MLGFTACGAAADTLLRCWAATGVATSAAITNKEGNRKFFIERLHSRTSGLNGRYFEAAWAKRPSPEREMGFKGPGSRYLVQSAGT